MNRAIRQPVIMLMAMINDPSTTSCWNAIEYAFLSRNHAIFDSRVGTFIEYGTTTGHEQEILCRALASRIYEKIIIGPNLQLEKYGIKIHHDDVAAAGIRIVKKNYVHRRTSSRWLVVNFWASSSDRKGLRVVRAHVSGLVCGIWRLWKWMPNLAFRRKPIFHFNSDGRLCVYPHRCCEELHGSPA